MRAIGRVLAAACVTACVAALAGPSLGAGTKTSARVFSPFTSAGMPTVPVNSRFGYCYSGSLAIDRSDAWRCFVGNSILDPCFSDSAEPNVVICPNRDVNGGVEIHLTRKLPQKFADHGSPSLRHQPWDIELMNGRHCVFSSGASNVVHGVRLNYFCGPHSKKGLWGYPDRHVEPWTIRIARFEAKSVKRRVAIRAAWM